MTDRMDTEALQALVARGNIKPDRAITQNTLDAAAAAPALAAEVLELRAEREAMRAEWAEDLVRLGKERRDAMAQAPAVKARPLEEWHEDMGDCVWWCWEDGAWLGEPAMIGNPLDSAWPGYHTHFTPHPDFPPAIDLPLASPSQS